SIASAILQYSIYLSDSEGCIRPSTIDIQMSCLMIAEAVHNSRYRFGFNGAEKIDEIYGDDNGYDLGARMYNPRLGKMFSPDPRESEYAWQSTYAYYANSPIWQIDYNGEGDYYTTEGKYLGADEVKDDNKVYTSTQGNYDLMTGVIDNTKPEYNVLREQSKYLGTVQQVFVTSDDVSDKRIQSLHPAIRMQATSFIKEANENSDGTLIRVAQGYRTYAEQDRLYAQGRTAPGSVVTKAKGGFSNHNFGLAFDIVGITNGKMDYDLDWESLSKLGKSKGFEWGGDWNFKDMPHFENMFGNGLKELRAFPKDGNGLPIIKP
ncbi:MAG TPA: M15 family metallopeptidase, partial [Chitinophagales bacterium]|nr:M15 family metallopeptidase [Chitinophagales bacterium]